MVHIDVIGQRVSTISLAEWLITLLTLKLAGACMCIFMPIQTIFITECPFTFWAFVGLQRMLIFSMCIQRVLTNEFSSTLFTPVRGGYMYIMSYSHIIGRLGQRVSTSFLNMKRNLGSRFPLITWGHWYRLRYWNLWLCFSACIIMWLERNCAGDKFPTEPAQPGTANCLSQYHFWTIILKREEEVRVKWWNYLIFWGFWWRTRKLSKTF
jgi:hypothetical protein